VRLTMTPWIPCFAFLSFVAHIEPGLALLEHPSRRAALKDFSAAAVGAIIVAGSGCVVLPATALADRLPLPNGPTITGVPGISKVIRQAEYDGQWSPPALLTNLGTKRILATELSPTQQAPFTDQELYYAPFLK
jgi:hypothetical protein